MWDSWKNNKFLPFSQLLSIMTNDGLRNQSLKNILSYPNSIDFELAIAITTTFSINPLDWAHIIIR